MSHRCELVPGARVLTNRGIGIVRQINRDSLTLTPPNGHDILIPWADLTVSAFEGDEATRRTGQRGPRWGITPPTTPWIRGHALAEAHRILTRPDPDSAARALQPWILRIPASTEALTTWTRDRLPTNQHANRLVDQAAAVRRRPGRRITALALPELSADQIPWIIPETLASRHLPALPGVTNRTRNAYAALCLARHLPDVTTWAQAAIALGLPGDSGIRTAKLCSAAMRTHHDTFTHGLARLARHLTATPTEDRRSCLQAEPPPASTIREGGSA